MTAMLRIPPIVSELIAHVSTGLAARSEVARATWQVPNPRPAEFVKVMQISSGRLSVAHAEVAMMFECWAASGNRADQLGALAYAIATAAELPSGAYCPTGESGTVAGPYALDDPDTKLPRSLFTVRYIVPVEAI